MIQIRNVSKRYGGTLALAGLDLDLHGGEIHAICGENGAGKSTLNGILGGFVTPDTGTICLEGRELVVGSVPAAEAAGIAMVHQESAAFLHLTACENHQILHEPGSPLWLDRAEMRRRTLRSLEELGQQLDVDVPIRGLSSSQRQMLAIARALATPSRLLILDEPTATLSIRETEALFSAIRRLREEGTCILYVSHRLEEIFELADRVTVLRDGQLVATQPTGELTREALVQQMVGRELQPYARESGTPGAVALEVRDLGREGRFNGINFTVRRGEVVVLAGLMGSGRSEVARAIVGLDPVDRGHVITSGRVALVPEDRQHEGLHIELPVRENLAMAQRGGLLLDRKGEQSNAARLIQQLAIKVADDRMPASSLSGGNQQKVLLGKWLATEPEVLILDEPTRGVDVGAKAQIHTLIRDLARQEKAVLVISSDMAEVLELADRVLVMREGTISGELPRLEATQERILELALPVDTRERADLSLPGQSHRRSGGQVAAVGAMLLAVMVLATLVNPHFLALANFSDMLVKVAPAIIVGSMMTLVILAREIDISVGSLMGLCAAVLGVACSSDRLGLPVPVGIAMCLGAGVLGGLLNGVLVAKARIPSIIVTLGMLSVFRGVTERLMGGRWIENLPDGLREFGTGRFLGIPHSVTMAAVAVLIGFWITRRTRFGLQVFALGSNPRTAELRGIPVDRLRLALFALTGLAAAVAALFSATQLQVIESGFGVGFELVVIAAVVVGGTSIRGGEGSMLGTLLGATLLGTIATVLIYLRLGDSATYWERAIQGGLILLAVAGDHFLRRNRSRS